MSQKFDARQSIYRGTLNQLSTSTNPELDNLLSSVNADLTALLRISANTPANLVVNVGGSDLLNAESNRRRAIPHIGTAYVQFASGTVTFPAASGGNIVCAPGSSSVLNVASGNFAAVLIYLDGAGNLNTIVGADAASATAAITNLPPAPDETLAAGFVIVQNVAGVIQNITQDNIRQFGTGTGGGSSGNVTSVETALRDYNNFAQTKYLDPNIFRQQKATKVDGSSTGSFDLVKNAFKMTSIGQTFVSTNLANAEFLAEGVDITDAHLYLHWLLDSIDPAATYSISRDGGTNWQNITMSRVGTASNAFRGYHVFADESVQQSLVTVAASGAGDTLNAAANQQLSSRFSLSTTSVIRSLDLQLNRATSASVGNLFVQIVKNNAGVPSTALADLVAESNAVAISSLATGNITVTVNLPNTVLVAGDYHIVLRTDAEYKAGTMNLAWRSAASGTLGATFNGTSWTGAASTKAQTIKGRAHDLRVRVTSSAANVFLEGMGVYFPSDDGLVRPNGTKNVQKFYFSGDQNRTSFQLNWTPDPDLLDILDPYRGQVYAIEPGVAQIQGNTVVFASNTFDFPGEDIVLVFRQVKGIAIDNSDANAAKNSEQDQNLLDVGSQIEELDFVSIPKISVPFTNIVNRAQIIDLSQDLNTRMGINRIMTQQVARVSNEFGPNGEPVFRSVNDRFDQIRFVGNFRSGLGIFGQNAQGLNINDYAEITFYGTGLNLITVLGGTSTDYRVSVDGGAESANIYPTASPVLDGRGYSSNSVINLASNLTLGLHTIRLRLNSSGGYALNIYGFEVLNETQNIRIRPGLQLVKGKARTLSVEDQESFNSGFELGTLGTRGGRVIVYQKADGSIAKAVTPTDATQLNTSAANHANEEVARVYNFREFGANRADDFSTLVTSSNRAFTLDDGTTTLVGSSVAAGVPVAGGAEFINFTAGGAFLTITFVGTGLDVIRVEPNTAAIDNHTIIVDGVLVDTLTGSGSTSPRVQRIVSGLPYGTHTVRITRSAAVNTGIQISQFIVYQPKTPSIPTGAKAIAVYNVMADFAANATAGIDRIATGVLRKQNIRELVYVNGTGGSNWTVGSVDPASNISGFGINSNHQNSYVEYTFFGTGFELRGTANTNRSTNIPVTLNGLAATTANFPGLTSSVYGGWAFASGTLNQNAALQLGAGMRISGLPLGRYTVRFNQAAASTANTFLDIASIDPITPIHSPKSNLFDTRQNTLTIGSQAIEDLRKIKSLEQITDQKAVSFATGIASNPTTTSLTAVPCPDMSVTHVSKTGRIRISYAVTRSHSATANTAIQPFVNGQAVGELTRIAHNVGFINTTSDSFVVNVPIGVNKVDLYWYAFDAGTTTGWQTARKLVVEDV
jgi:hypothetical protein